jgi:hypothetical protein
LSTGTRRGDGGERKGERGEAREGRERGEGRQGGEGRGERRGERPRYQNILLTRSTWLNYFTHVVHVAK